MDRHPGLEFEAMSSMTKVERELYDTLKGYLKVCDRFTCAACNLVHDVSSADDVYLWRPRNRVTKQLAQGRTGPYVICVNCSRKPEAETQPQIEATMAKQGLFG